MQLSNEKSIIAKRYQVDHPLGSGAFGTVYLCRDLKLSNLPVALKLFHPATLSQTFMRARIHRELRACFRVQHDNAVFFYDTVRDQELFGYTMEYIDGDTLSFACKRAKRPSQLQTLEILRQITLGLRAIHNCSIVHRDLKPANILLARSGLVKVTDYGLARPVSSGSGDSTYGAISQQISIDATHANGLVGSPAYICPDYLKTKRLTHRSDLYALGVIAFELLTSRRPFPEDTVDKLLLYKLNNVAPSVASIEPSTPQAICLLVARLLERNPEERFNSCDHLLDALEQCKRQLDQCTKLQAQPIPKVALKRNLNISVNPKSLDLRWSLFDLVECLRMRALPAGRGGVGAKIESLSSRFQFSELAVLATMLVVAFLGLGYLRGFLLESKTKSATQPTMYETNGLRFFTPSEASIKPIVRRPEQNQDAAPNAD